MNLNLSGRNALVGGSSKGIGRAVATELALLGANVTLVSRSPARLSEALSGLDTSQGQQHDFLVADFSDAEDLLEPDQRVDAFPVETQGFGSRLEPCLQGSGEQADSEDGQHGRPDQLGELETGQGKLALEPKPSTTTRTRTPRSDAASRAATIASPAAS